MRTTTARRRHVATHAEHPWSRAGTGGFWRIRNAPCQGAQSEEGDPEARGQTACCQVAEESSGMERPQARSMRNDQREQQRGAEPDRGTRQHGGAPRVDALDGAVRFGTIAPRGLRPTRNLTILAASRAAVRADVTPPRFHEEQEKIP